MIQYFHLPRVAVVCCFLLAFPSYGEKGNENPAFSASLYKWSTRPAESGDFPLKRELQIGLKIKEESDWKIAYFREGGTSVTVVDSRGSSCSGMKSDYSVFSLPDAASGMKEFFCQRSRGCRWRKRSGWR